MSRTYHHGAPSSDADARTIARYPSARAAVSRQLDEWWEECARYGLVESYAARVEEGRPLPGAPHDHDVALSAVSSMRADGSVYHHSPIVRVAS